MADLIDFCGLIVAQIRLRVSGLPPGVIVWGVRTFVQSFPVMQYREATSYLVPLENMYPPPAPSREEYEKGRKP
jgi:hypothetical protein